VPEEDIRSTSESPGPGTQDNMASTEATVEGDMTPVTAGKEVTEEEDAASKVEKEANREAII